MRTERGMGLRVGMGTCADQKDLETDWGRGRERDAKYYVNSEETS